MEESWWITGDSCDWKTHFMYWLEIVVIWWVWHSKIHAYRFGQSSFSMESRFVDQVWWIRRHDGFLVVCWSCWETTKLYESWNQWKYFDLIINHMQMQRDMQLIVNDNHGLREKSFLTIRMNVFTAITFLSVPFANFYDTNRNVVF